MGSSLQAPVICITKLSSWWTNQKKCRILWSLWFSEMHTLLIQHYSSADCWRVNIIHKAVSIIQQIRSNPQKPPRACVLKGIRKHVNPTLQWGSRNWWEIIEWEKARIDEPRILERITRHLHASLNTPAIRRVWSVLWSWSALLPRKFMGKRGGTVSF